MIYVAHILDGQFIKIGYCSKAPERRIASLQTGNPFLIEILFTVEGSLTQEKEIHKSLMKTHMLNKLRVPPNEWYTGSHKFFLGFLANLKESVNIGLAYLDDCEIAASHESAKKKEKYEFKLFKYGTEESIESYLANGKKEKDRILWPTLGMVGKADKNLCKAIVDFFSD